MDSIIALIGHGQRGKNMICSKQKASIKLPGADILFCFVLFWGFALVQPTL